MNTDPLKPSTSLLCKLGSIARHVEEGDGGSGVVFDMVAAVALLHDPEVKNWMMHMDDLHLLPVKR